MKTFGKSLKFLASQVIAIIFLYKINNHFIQRILGH